MAYKHGVYNTEQATSLTVPIQGSAGLQIIFGTAPIHLAKDPAAAVNTPQAGLQLQGGCGGRRLFGRFRELHPLPEH